MLQLDAAQLVLALQIEPELPAHAKERGQGEGGFSVDGTLALDDLVEGGTWNAGALREFRLGQAEGLKKFFLENASGGGAEDGRLTGHGLLVAIGDFDGARVAVVPFKTAQRRKTSAGNPK